MENIGVQAGKWGKKTSSGHGFDTWGMSNMSVLMAAPIDGILADHLWEDLKKDIGVRSQAP